MTAATSRASEEGNTCPVAKDETSMTGIEVIGGEPIPQ
jgi:hypothetical protein